MKIELSTHPTGKPNGTRSPLAKAGLIVILTIVLIIPSVWMQGLIEERQKRQQEVVQEIADKWSGAQLLQGPVLVLPYETTRTEIDPQTQKTILQRKLQHIYILPENLNIKGNTEPQKLHRGIFDAVVYNARLKVSGNFSALDLKKSDIDPSAIQWEKARMAIGLSDLKGLRNNPVIRLGNNNYPVEPDFTSLNLFTNTLIILPDLGKEKQTTLNFSFNLELRGTESLDFWHLARNTDIQIDGKWKDPSFTGRYLPESRTVSDSGFTVNWKLPYFNRSLPQQWIAEDFTFKPSGPTDETKTIKEDKPIPAAFGVKFLLPVDQYQKTNRAAKYAILIILLTFLALLFTELLRKSPVHLFQYILIGAAMLVYYTLLLSLSEHMPFNLAYILSSLATVLLISSFIRVLVKNRQNALIFGGILSLFYGFIFVIIQLQDMALLVGSVGLFILIGILMAASSKINWGGAETTPTETTKS